MKIETIELTKRERLLGRDNEPTNGQMLEFIGAKAVKPWKVLHEFMANNYDFELDLNYWGDKHGWILRYRKSGKTLVSFYPEKGGFTVQVILGKKEVEKFEGIRDELHEDILKLFDETEQFHDGRWLYIRQPEMGTTSDIEKLIQLKRKIKPKKS
ncbi:MAG: DUF3788 domain-containing protein [Candidatus Thorarchaeota archaeon]|jgi:hypothetical protein